MPQPTDAVPATIREQEAVVLQWQQTRSDEDFARVLHVHGGLLNLMIRRYESAITRFGLDFREADAVAAIGLWRAAVRYQGPGAFSTYAVWCIRGAITGWFRQHKRYRHASLEALADRLQDGGNRADDFLADDAAEQPDDQAGRRDLSAAMQALIDQHCSAREAVIIRLYFCAGWTLQAVGDREGLSRERIRQIIDEICSRLATAIKDPATLRLAELPPDVTTLDWGPVLNRQIRETIERDGALPAGMRRWLQKKSEHRARVEAEMSRVSPAQQAYKERRERFRRHVAKFLPNGGASH